MFGIKNREIKRLNEQVETLKEKLEDAQRQVADNETSLSIAKLDVMSLTNQNEMLKLQLKRKRASLAKSKLLCKKLEGRLDFTLKAIFVNSRQGSSLNA